MTNPQLGFEELAAAQEQPEVLVNGADRALSQAIGGQVTVNFSIDANYSLQVDEWQYGTIELTDLGTILSGGVDVIYPDVDTTHGGPSRLMFVFINSTGQALTVKRTGETGVTVAAGESALLYHNGTDIILLIDDIGA